MPTNDDRNFVGQVLNGSQAFIGNNIGIGRSTIFDVPLKGADFEIGGPIVPGIAGVRTYAGGYYYEGDGVGAAYGVRARAEATITNDLWAQVAVTNDPL